MVTLFYLAGVIAVIATLLAVTRRHAVHALLYLIVSLLAVAVDFYTLGAPFVAALEVIIYAGAIMVLFLFIVMMLNVAEHAMEVERASLTPRSWLGPSFLALVLFVELAFCAFASGPSAPLVPPVGPRQVGIALFGTYWIGVELASLLLTAGLVGAFHLGRHALAGEEEKHATHTHTALPDSRRHLVHPGTGRTSRAA